MSNIRLLGMVVGLALFLLSFRIFRGQKWNRANFFLFAGSGLFLFALSLNPGLINILQRMLALDDAERGRLMALLIFAVGVLWFALILMRTSFLKHKYQFDRFVRAVGIANYIEKIRTDLAGCDVAVLIPAYNEADNLRAVLPRIPKEVGGLKLGVVVVDDGSDDGTCECAIAAGAFAVRSPINRGGGAALRLGYDILQKADIDICVTMDADGQHNPEEIPALLSPLLEEQCDIVIGSRILGSREKDSLFRLAGVYFFSFIINRLTGLNITDPSSGFRAFKMDVVRRVPLDEDQFHTSELIINAAKGGFCIREAPITILRRKYGESKKGRNWLYGLNFAKIVVRSWWR
ncbi:glycosyltransferase family 2 protein [Desulfosudis oleivorans]|uniref:Glycosyl transferase family 2 n=1 Tax=Desulfosudis oleivorans (strain DSM 6200 / JCM 39069 / Hxd3) TaxID=96561 RepID=A8ZT92_DESOH|nr:glycosyltransferase family 2 protein [Desulfosudis oleivorans]ABW67775.1 glycosyl transferase family 2 [Desulfosudis oleivorans Hxd3]